MHRRSVDRRELFRCQKFKATHHWRRDTSLHAKTNTNTKVQRQTQKLKLKYKYQKKFKATSAVVASSSTAQCIQRGLCITTLAIEQCWQRTKLFANFGCGRGGGCGHGGAQGGGRGCVCQHGGDVQGDGRGGGQGVAMSLHHKVGCVAKLGQNFLHSS